MNNKMNGRAKGTTPAVALINPKYPHNVGAAIRAASCFGVGQVWYNGTRIDEAIRGKGRLPREERLKAYGDVELCHMDYLYDAFPGAIPVAVEVSRNAEPLNTFIHPEKALYVFGPEDGGLSHVDRMHCHRHVVIPTRHCTNLAAAVYLVLYDRLVKDLAVGDGTYPTPGQFECRGLQDDFGTYGE